MTRILLLSFLFSSFTAFSQTEKAKKTPKHKTILSIGLTASPDIYIYDFKAYPDFSFTYNSQFNYSAGIVVIYYPVKLLSLRVAALYSTKGFSLDYNYSTTNPNLNPDSVAVNTTIVADYIDLPIILHLNIIHKDRVQLFLAAGIVLCCTELAAPYPTILNEDYNLLRTHLIFNTPHNPPSYFPQS